MKRLSIILFLLPAMVYSQGIGTRVNALTGAFEQYVQNSPGNGIFDSRMVSSLKDSTWHLFNTDSFLITSIRNTVNHGTPTTMLFSTASGAVRTCPLSNLPFVTQAGARSALSSGTGINYNSSTGVIASIVAVTGDGVGGANPTYTISEAARNNYAGYGTGTAYTMTTTSAKVTFGTTSPTVTLGGPGTYRLTCNLTLDYNGLTTLSLTPANFKLRRTNNTAADITNAAQTFRIPVLTLASQTGGNSYVPEIFYTTATTGDVIELWGGLGTAISVGSVTITNAYVTAVKMY
jgi:hypothetical protein